MSSMNVVGSQRGALNVLLIPLILAVVFFFASVGFGAWAYTSRAGYKDKSDEKVAKAVAVEVQKAKSEKDNEFVEKEKQPLKAFQGPEALGSIAFQYPKTWSFYDNEATNVFSLTFHPDRIPADKNTAYALRVEVVNTPYAQVASTFDADVKKKTITASAYSLPQLPSVLGLRFDGQIDKTKRGSVVILPLRDKTIKIWTEGEQYVGDFNALILKNFSFKP
jgi:hypothetical protein